MARTIADLAEKRRKWVVANQENGFEAGLKRLLTELYPDNAHFIYELLQNAEDAQAQEVRFVLHEDRIEFEHNGARLFDINDVDAITSIGFSTKRDDATSIGKFGVGFKAVFAYTETPKVESGEFHFQIHDMVVPTPEEPCRVPCMGKKTQFVLPFDNPKKPQEQALEEIKALLKVLDATTLLFLTHIRKIEYLLPDSSLGYIERIDLGRNRYEIRVQQPNEHTLSSTWFMKFDKDVDVEDEEAEKEAEKTKTCRIAVAFGLRPLEPKTDAKGKKAKGSVDATPDWELAPMEPGRVCIYFPAYKETSNLRFHLHAPFASTVARDSVRDCAGNRALRDHLAELLGESMRAIRDQGLLTLQALAVLPNDKDNLSEFYQPLMDRLVAEFKGEDLVPMKLGGHAASDGIFRGAKVLSDLIGDADLATLLGEDYNPPLWAANPPQRNQREDSFLSMLDIEQWGTDKLVASLLEMGDITLCKWLHGKDDKWHQRLLGLLIEYVESAPKYLNGERRKRLLKAASLPFIRCADNIFRKAQDCFFPSDGVDSDKKFPRVARGLYISDKEQDVKARQFLEEMGVREVDERVQVKAILESKYAQEAKHPARKEHYAHLRRFMRFLEDNANEHALFSEAHLFMVDGEDGIEWRRPSGIYLDSPFMETGLRCYYDLPEVNINKKPLSNEYQTSSLSLDDLASFCRRLGAASKMELERCQTSWGYAGSGRRQTASGIDEDYQLPKELVDPKCFSSNVMAVGLARLIWNTMSSVPASQLRGKYRPNQQYAIEQRDSKAVCSLRTTMWVPQEIDGQTEFVYPRDAIPEKLPAGFRYETNCQWLNALEFGKSARESREAISREQERQSAEYKRKEEIAKDIGFESPEEAEEVARLKREHPDEFKRFLESIPPKKAAKGAVASMTDTQQEQVAYEYDDELTDHAPDTTQQPEESKTVIALLHEAFNSPGEIKIAEEWKVDSYAYEGTSRNPERRIKKVAEDLNHRKANEPSPEERRPTVERQLLAPPDPQVKQALLEWYGGQCQICRRTWPERDGRPYFAAARLVERQHKEWVDHPGNVICLCAEHFAQWRLAAKEEPLPVDEQIESLCANPEGGNGNISILLLLLGKEVEIHYCEKHALELKAFLEVAHS